MDWSKPGRAVEANIEISLSGTAETLSAIETLKIEPAEMEISSATLSSDNVLSVRTKGDIDLIELNFQQSSSHQTLGIYWQVQGEPTVFNHVVLPDLSAIIPHWFAVGEGKPSLRVNACLYDQLNAADLHEGLPYKFNDGALFPEARSGLKKIYKTF